MNEQLQKQIADALQKMVDGSPEAWQALAAQVMWSHLVPGMLMILVAVAVSAFVLPRFFRWALAGPKDDHADLRGFVCLFVGIFCVIGLCTLAYEGLNRLGVAMAPDVSLLRMVRG